MHIFRRDSSNLNLVDLRTKEKKISLTRNSDFDCKQKIKENMIFIKKTKMMYKNDKLKKQMLKE